MSVFYEWVDFVTFPLDPRKCYTQRQRLDTTNAIHVNTKDYTPELGTEKGAIITKNIILFDDDELEAMSIDNGGGVIIWTRKRVWLLQNQETREKLIFLPRHPNLD